MRKFTQLKFLFLLLAMAVGGSAWAQTTETVLTLDCATPAPTGSTSTALSTTSDVATFLNSAADLSSAQNKITCGNKSGDVYKGKGSGGDGIPQQCLKVGKASGGGGFTFTIPNTYDEIGEVEMTCYGWKTTSSISINSGTAQTFTTAQTKTTKTFKLSSSTRTISINVTTSAVCITEIVLKKSSAPSITANNVDIAYNETSGSIEYSLANATGNVSAVVTTGGDWLTLGTITENEVPFTCSANTAHTARTATVTLSHTDATDKVVTITQAATPTYTVTYVANGGTGTMTDENSPYEENEEVTLLANTFTAPTGYGFNGWSVKDASNVDVTVTDGKFSMPASNVTVTAQWQAYSITAQSNNDSYGTVSLSGSVITGSPNSGYRYATPAYTVAPANSATVAQEGNEFTVTPSANTTVTINFEEIPSHEVTYSVNDVTARQLFAEGATITFPSDPEDINGKKFVGWVTEPINGTTDNEPEFVTSATMSTNDITYYAVFAAAVESSETKLDALTSSVTGITNSSYADFSNKTVSGGSNAVYAGNCAGSNTYIQLRTSSNTGLVTTTSGGKAKKVTVVWNSTSDRALQVYGSNTAYTELNDIFNDEKKGTLLGTLTYNSDTELSITGDYGYIGIKPDSSKSGASQLSSITIEWEASIITYSAYCTSVGAAVAVTGVTLDQASKSLFVGDEFDLTATVAPANATVKSVTWTSSDETKATVVNGHVTALAAGTPTITVTTTDGSFTATCNLTISNVAVTGVTLDKTSATIYTGSVGNTVQLTPTIAPANATIKTVSWESDDTDVATVDVNGLVTAGGTGTATITVTTTDGNFTATCDITVEDAPGSAVKPYTVAQAKAAIDAGTGLMGVYVKGIVSRVDSYDGTKYITYWISDDGTTTNQFEVYKGLDIDGASFSAVTDVKVGDKVVVKGDITKFSSTYEFSKDNQLVSKETLDFAFGAASYSVEQGGDLTITASSSNSSGAITYSSNATDVAEINASTGVVTAKKEGETTISATIAAADGFPSKSIDVTLTVTDNREAANISFANAEVFALDEDGTYTQAATVAQVDYDGTITYEIESFTSDGALIDDFTGELLFEKKGTIVVKATAGATATYKSNTATYTLKVRTTPTIVVSNQSIAYNEIYTYDVASYVEGGTVTITSSNENVVKVNGYELGGIAVGTSIITVATSANDEYIEGSETFVLTVTAPVGGTTAMTADDVVLFHETFGDNSGSAREWDDSYSVKSGVSAVYSGITSYTVSNVKQGKNTTGSTASGLNQSSTSADSYIIIGPLNVAEYKNMKLTYQWNAGSTKGTYSTSASYATSSEGDYTEISGTGAGATTFVERSYNLPAAAQVSTLYLKIVWKTSNTQGIIDEVNLSCPGSATESVTLNKYGYATYCSVNPIDFSSTTGYTAWRVGSVAADGTITFSRITEKIKGGQGVLLYNKDADGENTTDVTINFADGTTEFSAAENLLEGTLAPTYVAANEYYGLKGDTFVPVNAGTVPAGKALLPASVVPSASRLTFVFEDASGIADIERSTLNIENGIYNLSGQRVDSPKKGGLYIMNGKKVVMK